MKKLKIGIACDHAAFKEKEELIKRLTLFPSKYLGDTPMINDYGCLSDKSVDYPDYAHLLADAIANKKIDRGILICGSGIGISIAANRHKGVRAALCTSEFHAEMSRKHNDANVIAFGSRFTDVETMVNLTIIFLGTQFEGERHLRRVEKIEIK